MLQKHILELKKQDVANQSEIEEIEQYGRRQCLKFEGVPIEKNKTSDKVLTKVMIGHIVARVWSRGQRKT